MKGQMTSFGLFRCPYLSFYPEEAGYEMYFGGPYLLLSGKTKEANSKRQLAVSGSIRM